MAVEAVLGPEEREGFVSAADALRAEGRKEGRKEGRAEGLASAILTVFEVREMEVPNPVRARIEGCKDVGLLEAWQRRAMKVAAAEDIFAE